MVWRHECAGQRRPCGGDMSRGGRDSVIYRRLGRGSGPSCRRLESVLWQLEVGAAVVAWRAEQTTVRNLCPMR